jgi:phosphotransferase system enzyme I (PtsI)
MIAQVIKSAKKAGIPVGLCGEMAGDPLCVPLFLGLGLDELSMHAGAIPFVKKAIRAMSFKEARRDFKKIMKLTTATEVRAFISERVKKLVPELEESGFLLS